VDGPQVWVEVDGQWSTLQAQAFEAGLQRRARHAGAPGHFPLGEPGLDELAELIIRQVGGHGGDDTAWVDGGQLWRSPVVRHDGERRLTSHNVQFVNS
jgi:hypothetical protein